MFNLEFSTALEFSITFIGSGVVAMAGIASAILAFRLGQDLVKDIRFHAHG
jgi:hypothetical protein